MLKLGENIKRLRLLGDLTQEQLAEVLGVSPQAVSRWENSSAYPDITLLPALANYFSVSTDELLGVDVTEQRKEIEQIMRQNDALHTQGKIEESVELLREKIRLYPKSADLACQLAHSLYQRICGSRLKPEKELNEIISLCERAVSLDKGETYVTYLGRQTMCYAYCMLGRKDDAYKIAEGMPSMWVCREIMLNHVLSGEEELDQRQHLLLSCMDFSILDLHHIARKMSTPEESIILLKKAIQLADILTGEDHKFYNERVFKCYLWIARAYCRLGDEKQAFDNLELALRYAVMFEQRPECSEYEVFWLKGYEDKRKSARKNSEETLYQHLLDKIAEEPFKLLHDSGKYSEFRKKVEEYL